MTSDQVAKHGTTDVALIGAGIMSATLGALLRRLQPDWDIQVFERLEGPAMESSDAWNNAGTGHSALCELNYSPKTADGDVDITKAVGVNEKFQVSPSSGPTRWRTPSSATRRSGSVPCRT